MNPICRHESVYVHAINLVRWICHSHHRPLNRITIRMHRSHRLMPSFRFVSSNNSDQVLLCVHFPMELVLSIRRQRWICCAASNTKWDESCPKKISKRPFRIAKTRPLRWKKSAKKFNRQRLRPSQRRNRFNTCQRLHRNCHPVF